MYLSYTVSYIIKFWPERIYSKFSSFLIAAQIFLKKYLIGGSRSAGVMV